jgi:hypothetical protein
VVAEVAKAGVCRCRRRCRVRIAEKMGVASFFRAADGQQDHVEVRACKAFQSGMHAFPDLRRGHARSASSSSPGVAVHVKQFTV